MRGLVVVGAVFEVWDVCFCVSDEIVERLGEWQAIAGRLWGRWFTRRVRSGRILLLPIFPRLPLAIVPALAPNP